MAETVEKDVKISVARNKRARHDYHILDTWEAGVVLTGSEVKSLRNGKANIADSYAIVKDGEVFLLNLHISPYEQASYFNHEPTRTRKLLLHRKEIRKMIGAVERQGLTLIPLEIYFKRGKAKIALALPGVRLDLIDGIPFAKRDTLTIPLTRAPQVRGGQLYLPFQFVSEVIPRYVGGYIYDVVLAELRTSVAATAVGATAAAKTP